MLVPFEALPSSARIWTYVADRSMDAETEAAAIAYLESAISGWVTHGKPLRGSFKIYHHRAVVIAADVAFQAPSGCSIDASTAWLKDLGQRLGIDFFDRSVVYFEDNALKTFSLFEGRKWVEAGRVSPETKILNVQAGTVGDLAENFIIPASESFLGRYFKAVK